MNNQQNITAPVYPVTTAPPPYSTFGHRSYPNNANIAPINGLVHQPQGQNNGAFLNHEFPH